MGENLVGLEPVVELLTTVVWTARVNGERPISLILVAPPGSGKTSALRAMKSNFTVFTDDLTSREFNLLVSRYQHMTHLMLSDMTSIFNRKSSTSDLTCNILRRAVEEGIEVDSYSGKHYDEVKKIGFITAIPPDDLGSRKVSGTMEEGGFASRFLIASYRYSAATKKRVHDYIRSDAYTNNGDEREKKFEDRRSSVKIPDDIAEQIHLLAIEIKRDPLGARAHHHLRALVKARALEENRTIATEEDFKKVEYYSEFFTEKGKVI